MKKFLLLILCSLFVPLMGQAGVVNAGADLFYIAPEIFLAPSASDSTAYLASAMIDSCTSKTAVTTQPGYSRIVNIALYHYGTWTDSVGAGSICIYGRNISGDSICETITLKYATGAGTPVLSVKTNRAFAYISGFVCSSSLADTASYGDTLTIGEGSWFELSTKIYQTIGWKDADTMTFLIQEGGAMIPGKSAGYNSTYNLYKPVTAPNGTYNYILYFKRRLPTK